jgi:aminodeoxyfutalosine synthase
MNEPDRRDRRRVVEVRVRDPQLRPIADKVLAGDRLSFGDGQVLYRTPDLPAVMRLADVVRERKVGAKAYFVHSLRLSQTNVCYVGLHLLRVRQAPRRRGCVGLRPRGRVGVRRPALAPRPHRVHIASGHHPKRPWDYYLDLVRGLTERYPGVQVKAWTAAEIHHFTKITRPRLTYREVLAQLKEAGLVAMPGGGAEIFAEDVRRRIARAKVTAEGWLEVHRTAHELEIPTNATMLYGHVETLDDRLDHMDRLRRLQDETGGFMSFIPLAYQPEHNPLAAELEAEGKRVHTTGVDDLRNLAVARLYLDNVPHVKGYWIMITPEHTQVALAAGVSDVDGTIKDEKIAHASGAVTEAGMTEDQLVALIRGARAHARPARRALPRARGVRVTRRARGHTAAGGGGGASVGWPPGATATTDRRRGTGGRRAPRHRRVHERRAAPLGSRAVAGRTLPSWRADGPERPLARRRARPDAGLERRVRAPPRPPGRAARLLDRHARTGAQRDALPPAAVGRVGWRPRRRDHGVGHQRRALRTLFDADGCRWRSSPCRAPDLDAMLGGYDGALLIGDAALEEAVARRPIAGACRSPPTWARRGTRAPSCRSRSPSGPPTRRGRRRCGSSPSCARPASAGWGTSPTSRGPRPQRAGSPKPSCCATSPTSDTSSPARPRRPRRLRPRVDPSFRPGELRFWDL